MELELIRVWDGSGGTNCPALYKTDNGDYVVQGWELDDASRAKLQNLGANETAVRVPASVIAGIVASTGN